MTKSFDVLTVGEALICLTGRPGRLQSSAVLAKSIGGAEANVGIGLARLGASTAFASRVGADPFGAEILRTLRAEGVDVGAVRQSRSSPTGLMIKEPRNPNDVHVYYYRSSSAATEMKSADFLDVLARSARLHVSGITLSIGAAPRRMVQELVAQARADGIPVSLDPNFRTKLGGVEQQSNLIHQLLPDVTDLLLSESEAEHLVGIGDPWLAIDALLELGPERVVVRRGEHGSVAGDRLGRRCEMQAFLAGNVVDTVGAGDAFTAGYLFELTQNATLEAAIATGSWLAGHVVTHPGDYEGAPYRDEYDMWQAQREVAGR